MIRLASVVLLASASALAPFPATAQERGTGSPRAGMLLVPQDLTAATYLLEACSAITADTALSRAHSRILLSESSAQSEFRAAAADILHTLEGNVGRAVRDPALDAVQDPVGRILSRLGPARTVCHEAADDADTEESRDTSFVIVYAQWHRLPGHGSGLLIRRLSASLPVALDDRSRFHTRFIPLEGLAFGQAVRAVLRHIALGEREHGQAINAAGAIRVPVADGCARPPDASWCVRQTGSIELSITLMESAFFEASELTIADPSHWVITGEDGLEAPRALRIAQSDAQQGTWLIHPARAGHFTIDVPVRPAREVGARATRHLRFDLVSEAAGMLLHSGGALSQQIAHPSFTLLSLLYPVISWTRPLPGLPSRGTVVLSGEDFVRLAQSLRDALIFEEAGGVRISDAWRHGARNVLDDDAARVLIRTALTDDLDMMRNERAQACQDVAASIADEANILGPTTAGESLTWTARCIELVADARGPLRELHERAVMARNSEASVSIRVQPVVRRFAASRTIITEAGTYTGVVPLSSERAIPTLSYRFTERVRVCAAHDATACEDFVVVTSRNRIGWVRASMGVSVLDRGPVFAAVPGIEVGLPILAEIVEFMAGVHFPVGDGFAAASAHVAGALLPTCIAPLVANEPDASIFCRDFAALRIVFGGTHRWDLTGSEPAAWRWFWGVEVSLRPVMEDEAAAGLDLSIGIRRAESQREPADTWVFVGVGAFL